MRLIKGLDQCQSLLQSSNPIPWIELTRIQFRHKGLPLKRAIIALQRSIIAHLLGSFRQNGAFRYKVHRLVATAPQSVSYGVKQIQNPYPLLTLIRQQT
jgi:hypothetical protein